MHHTDVSTPDSYRNVGRVLAESITQRTQADVIVRRLETVFWFKLFNIVIIIFKIALPFYCQGKIRTVEVF